MNGSTNRQALGLPGVGLGVVEDDELVVVGVAVELGTDDVFEPAKGFLHVLYLEPFLVKILHPQVDNRIIYQYICLLRS